MAALFTCLDRFANEPESPGLGKRVPRVVFREEQAKVSQPLQFGVSPDGSRRHHGAGGDRCADYPKHVIRFLFVLLVCLQTAGARGLAGTVTVEGAADSDTLHDFTIVSDGHRFRAPKTEVDQQGFEQVKVSRDGQTVGWLADKSNCCTSYPLPMVLVLWRGGKVIHRFTGAPPTFHWAFGPGADEVVLQQEYPHGPEYITYSRMRISSGKQLARYKCDQNNRTKEPQPGWTRLVHRECPAYNPAPE